MFTNPATKSNHFLLTTVVAAIAAVALFLSSAVAAELSSVRTVQGGQIQGAIIDGAGEFDIEVYKNIPYAAAPEAELRWRPPQPVESWQGVRKTEEYGAACQQGIELKEILDTMIDGQGMGWLRNKVLKFLIGFAPQPELSEDCLSVNVWAPESAKNLADPVAPRPVMVWVHGGGHQGGSAADGIYEGDKLASKGVVVVTFNYRLGAFGYMAHPALSAEAKQLNGIASSGNYGLLDQIAALQWVKDNIAAFGGDPDKVTIFGESAGGHSVGQIMASPLAQGLFHRAIAQSGLGSHNYLHLSKDMPGLKSAEHGGQSMQQAAAIDDEDVLQKLRGLSAAKIVELSAADVELGNYFHPNVDGWALPVPVANAFSTGKQADVPLLIGSNADEGTLFSIFEMPPLFASQALPRTLSELSELLVTEFGAEDAQTLLAHYEVKEDADVPAARLNIWGDSYFGAQAIYGAHHMSSVSSPAFLYFFTRTPPSDKQTLGATHASEVPFVFGSPMPMFPANDFDEELSETMTDYWVNFAKTGLPIAKGRDSWPQYVASNPRQMVFDEQSRVEPIQRSRLYEIFTRRHQRVQAEVDKRLAQ